MTTTSEGNRGAFPKHQGVSLPNAPHGTNREVALKDGRDGLQLVQEARVRTMCGRGCMAEKGSEKKHNIRREKNIAQQYMCQRTQLERLKPGSQPSLHAVVQEGSMDPGHWGRRCADGMGKQASASW